jgi:outer membrane protein insertion porin family
MRIGGSRSSLRSLLEVLALAAILPGGIQSCRSAPETIGGAPVVFEGRSVFSESVLLEQIQSELDRYRASPEASLLSDAAFRIAHFYDLEGYSGTRVEFTVSPDRLLFKIDEAPYVALGKVRLRGNRALSETELLSGLPGRLLGSAPFSERAITAVKNHVIGEYAARGYSEVLLGEAELSLDPGKKHMDVILPVSEGRQYRVQGFEGMPDLPALQKKLSLIIGLPFTPHTADEIEAAILDEYREHGHPFIHARVRPDLDRSAGLVVLALEVEPGPETHLGELKIVGNRRTRASFMESRSDLETGKEYQESDLRRAEKRLAATTLFTRVQVSPGPVQEDQGRVPVDIRVEERDAGDISLSMGYGTLDGPRGGTEFRYANLLGGAELFRAGATVSRFGYRAESEVASPFIFGSDFRPGLSGFYEKETYPSFTAVSYGGDLSISYPILEKLQATVGVRHAIVHTTEVDFGVSPGDLLDFSYTAPFLTVQWDLRDNPLLPTKGVFVDGRLEWSDRVFSPDLQFRSASGKAAFFVPLPLELVLAASLQGGVIAPIEETQRIPIALRYFAGGTNTVRGFKFASLGPQVDGQPTGGEAFLALQTELRYPIWGDLHGAVFSDRGGVWEDYRRVDLADTRYSVGMGLRYYTPAGAIATDFALNPARQPGERGWEFHFSIGFPF